MLGPADLLARQTAPDRGAPQPPQSGGAPVSAGGSAPESTGGFLDILANSAPGAEDAVGDAPVLTQEGASDASPTPAAPDGEAPSSKERPPEDGADGKGVGARGDASSGAAVSTAAAPVAAAVADTGDGVGDRDRAGAPGSGPPDANRGGRIASSFDGAGGGVTAPVAAPATGAKGGAAASPPATAGFGPQPQSGDAGAQAGAQIAAQSVARTAAQITMRTATLVEPTTTATNNASAATTGAPTAAAPSASRVIDAGLTTQPATPPHAANTAAAPTPSQPPHPAATALSPAHSTGAPVDRRTTTQTANTATNTATAAQASAVKALQRGDTATAQAAAQAAARTDARRAVASDADAAFHPGGARAAAAVSPGGARSAYAGAPSAAAPVNAAPSGADTPGAAPRNTAARVHGPDAARAEAEAGPRAELAAPLRDAPSQQLRPDAPATPTAGADRSAAQAAAIGRQAALALSSSGGERIEIRIDPPELGRLTLSLTFGDERVIAQIGAERPETGDLLRRHGDALQRELAAAGFGDVALDFGGQGAAGEHGDDETAKDAAEDADTAGRAGHFTQTRGGVDDGRLDVRL